MTALPNITPRVTFLISSSWAIFSVSPQVCPNDPLPVYNYGVCMRQLGELELAVLAFRRADELGKAKGMKAKDKEDSL